mmetsp:Transcript_5531/g.13974  ORF Transcript_5531/g.13974 Transcript_5531/m.13974 type:complete len:736 (+) Transcript_5531:105-2312(+)|eukprot:CAMPEP_0177648060 /NCGR_PEP_ID=MMETSP0447-20121125/10629_1 /TAXON_ID=0 /ORGANISM="Stygamoeba regulata, Strain BSH-02190019" /LENGTH=735 /DNA_ID=CAMNT_0019150681 /DNA_START=302 /DNA_END=2509 /DNA_ORIENTATION=+
MSATIASAAAPSRRPLCNARRVVIKVGTGVVSHQSGLVALGRLAYLVEQIGALARRGYQVILVSSGAIGLGKLKLRRRRLISTTLHEQAYSEDSDGTTSAQETLNRARASAGQSELLALYERLFSQHDLSCSQLLLLDSDFSVTRRRDALVATLDQLLQYGVIPVINENDAMSPRSTPVRDQEHKVFWDNDSLACLIGKAVNADLILLLSDVEGLCTAPPGSSHSEVVHTYRPGMKINIGAKSMVGRGGMDAKVEAAMSAVNGGVPNVVIASGFRPNVVLDVLEGKLIGTLFTNRPSAIELVDFSPKAAADGARQGAQALQQLTTEERRAMLYACADAIISNAATILDANAKDIAAAKENQLGAHLLNRLALTQNSLETLANGMRQVADLDEPLNRVLRHSLVSEGLELKQITVPLGVLLIIFESRPGVLAQVSSLALKTGNGLILKGGTEAKNSNLALHSVITDAISTSTQGRVPKSVVSLVMDRQAVSSLLKLEGHIDLIIPRGSNALVSHIKSSTHIPVLGHADGVCHVYIDEAANLDKALSICIDSKTNYPAACNAVETILLHKSLAKSGFGDQLIHQLREVGVTVLGSGEACRRYELDQAKSLHVEYGNLTVTLVIVSDVLEAVEHINLNGSGHTEAVVTENKEVADTFLASIDSACAFWNASTRFADGFRFGLGCEVGISTSKIHARGPVGVDGLLSTKWILKSASSHIVDDFAKGKKTYLHQKLPASL